MPDADDRATPADRTTPSKVNIPRDLHQRARAAVRIVQRVTGRPYTIAQFLREAIMAQLAVIARDYNRGQEIFPDTEPLEPGRR
ncbi:hypothetical protein [Mycolicibacterium fortuitum]|uniref:hypothetical protein n=1 Tax=Mycolicibacterium fortuitum TaxID=1766 RepID=UPI003AB0EE24